MVPDPFAAIPDDSRDAVRSAVAATFGSARVASLVPVPGGASGAMIRRLDLPDRAYLLRVETTRNALSNPHHYMCMRAAAEAGIAPRLHHLDEAAGIAIMDFVTRRPLSEYPGGPLELARISAG